jgi:hypothetical protein
MTYHAASDPQVIKYEIYYFILYYYLTLRLIGHRSVISKSVALNSHSDEGSQESIPPAYVACAGVLEQSMMAKNK